jgi:hypothetical protein
MEAVLLGRQHSHPLGRAELAFPSGDEREAPVAVAPTGQGFFSGLDEPFAGVLPDGFEQPVAAGPSVVQGNDQ